jgi:HAD superfamily hydrolase (TIGR01548 family)
MTYYNKGQGIFIEDSISETIGQIDGVIFDCDGVLVDVSKSYDLAIKQTTAFILKKFANLESIPITTEMIDGFKDTGGFNDEVDVTYASILSLSAAKKLGVDPEKFILDVINNADKTGIESVEKFLDSQNVDLSEIRKKLDYPGSRSNNPLIQIFDQIFYGPKLYEKIFHKKSQFIELGLIENDLVLITAELLSSLKKKFGNKLAIVTGRGKESIGYSLKELLDEFNVASCVFLEDESRDLAKPNPKPLIMAIEKLKTSHCLYVGDSMEDLMMANEANKMGRKVTFCGIYGTNKNPHLKRQFFEKNRVPIILESINQILNVVNGEKRRQTASSMNEIRSKTKHASFDATSSIREDRNN